MPDIDQLLVETQSHIRSYIAALGVPLCDVDDIAQDVYLTVSAAPERVPDGVEPGRWLAGIARNLAQNYFRKRHRRGQAMARLAETLDAAPSSAIAQADEDPINALRHCLGRLDERQQDMVLRYYANNEQADALAADFARSADGVRRLMMQLRRTLRACVERSLLERRA